MSESNSAGDTKTSNFEDMLLDLIAKSEVQGAILRILLMRYFTNEDKELIEELIHKSQSLLKNKQELSRTDEIMHEKQLKYLDLYLPKSKHPN
ncbi:hypothetical protein G3341_06650 [Providencia vermicola]|uniref:hypothetical protein n=1 Tax=Providencia vermicola TaxID=333965 RepID=UPI0013A7A9EB|nr:hypothetical protein [Providencia vermicola]QIC15403.1 hypothetical protein G3341_06650 [Providencia vermicola]